MIAPRPDFSRLVDPGGIHCHAADLTFTACTTSSPAELDTALAPLGQFFPVDGPPDGELGLMLAHDSTGPLRLGFGGWRDMLLGVQFEDGRGRLITVGGRVMKNVAGYDLTKFMVGQRSVFGKIITLTCRTYKRPHCAVAARFSGVADLTTLRPTPSWVLETRGGTWAGWLGDAAMADFVVEHLAHETGVQVIRQTLADDAALRSRLWISPATDSNELSVSVRAAVPVGRVGAFIVDARVKEWVADPWHGIVLMTVPSGQLQAARRAAHALGGRADAAGVPVRLSAQEAAILRRIKAEWDPDNTLPPLELEVE